MDLARPIVMRVFNPFYVSPLTRFSGLSREEAVALKIKSLTLAFEDFKDYLNTLQAIFGHNFNPNVLPNALAFLDGPNDKNV